MAYVAMNMSQRMGADALMFLNGVCRHELLTSDVLHPQRFLNGVCRHELSMNPQLFSLIFLNGVCRHEPD